MDHIEIKVVGPSRYCPDCGNILLEMHDNETLTVHPKSYIHVDKSGEYDAYGNLPDEIEVVPEAYCLRWRCRFKRWRRDEKIPRPYWDEDALLQATRRSNHIGLGILVAILAVVILQLLILIERIT